ncbi:MAG: DUF2490 domain-containing protein [Bacteriovoracaceae bacterium]|nr:DUF2490 domain-containing protein [Bacteriovoracaceae bacterium]
MSLHYLSILFLLIFSVNLSAKEQIDTEMYWLGININKPLTDKNDLLTELRLRQREGHYNMHQAFTRFSVGHALNNRWNLRLGTDAIANYANTSSAPTYEYRLWPGIRYTYNAEKFRFISFTRYEFRKRESVDDHGERLRMFFRFQHPNLSGYRFFYLSNEFFFNINHSQWGDDHAFDRNRFAIGLALPYDEEHRLEIEYMNEYIPRTQNTRYNHILGVILVLNF